jgi:hypothetical protein
MRRCGMSYHPSAVVEAYERNAQLEDASEKGLSLRVELPRAFIKKYLQPSDLVLDAGGRTGINAILMARRCHHVTLIDITAGILHLAGENVEALEIYEHGECACGMGPRTHTYTVAEMTELLERNGCRVLEVASTPTVSDTVDTAPFREGGDWERLKELELELCTRPELLGVGHHLLFVARKEA